MEFDPKFVVSEFKKCKEDPSYFINHYIKVIHPVRGLVKFKLYAFQERILKDFHENRFSILRKFRQAGCTTLACAYVLWFCIFNKRKTVAILSKGDAEAMEFLERVKIMHDELPSFLKPSIVLGGNNKRTLKFTNGSTIRSRASGKQAGRSIAGSLLIVDEAAFIENIKDIWQASYPVLSCVAKDTLILTQDGFREIQDIFTEEVKIKGRPFELRKNIFGKNGLEYSSHGLYSGESETIKIETSRGLILEITPKHPIYSLRESSLPEMVEAKKLKLGDYVRIDHSMNIFGKYSIPDDIAYILGGYIAEGWISKSGIWVSNSDKEFRDVFIRNGFSESRNSIKLRKGKKKDIDYLTSFGINPKWRCDTKRIPKLVWNSDKRSQCLFLQGLFDGDGSCNDLGDINYTSTSRKLIQEVQLLLLNLGIISSIIFTPKERILEWSKNKLLPSGKKLKSARDTWNIRISRGEAQKYKELINFRIYRKSIRLNCKIASKDMGKAAYVPKIFIRSQLKTIIEKSKLKNHTFRKMGLRLDKMLDSRTNRRISIKSLEKLKLLLEPEIVTEFKEFFDEYCRNSIWDPIVKIEKSRSETYDLTLPESSSFLQNGILGSNTGGAAIVLSTVNGIGNWFFDTYNKAIKKANTFKALDIKWQEHPEYFPHKGYEELYQEMLNRTPPQDINKWEETTRANISLKQWLAEYEAQFLGTGDTYITGEVLKQLKENVSENFYERYQGEMRIWKDPKPGRTYLLAGDSSLGRGFDNSAFHIFDLYDGEQVAEYYSNKVPLNEFARIIHMEANRYNNAIVLPERNSLGIVLIDQLINELGYDNMYDDEKGEAGILVSARNREEILAQMEEELRTNRLLINSERTVMELLTFIINEKTRKPEADEGQTDDLVMSLAFVAFAKRNLVGTPGIQRENEPEIPKIISGEMSKYKVRLASYGDAVEEDITWVLK